MSNEYFDSFTAKDAPIDRLFAGVEIFPSDETEQDQLIEKYTEIVIHNLNIDKEALEVSHNAANNNSEVFQEQCENFTEKYQEIQNDIARTKAKWFHARGVAKNTNNQHNSNNIPSLTTKHVEPSNYHSVLNHTKQFLDSSLFEKSTLLEIDLATMKKLAGMMKKYAKIVHSQASHLLRLENFLNEKPAENSFITGPLTSFAFMTIPNISYHLAPLEPDNLQTLQQIKQTVNKTYKESLKGVIDSFQPNQSLKVLYKQISIFQERIKNAPDLIESPEYQRLKEVFQVEKMEALQLHVKKSISLGQDQLQILAKQLAYIAAHDKGNVFVSNIARVLDIEDQFIDAYEAELFDKKVYQKSNMQLFSDAVGDYYREYLRLFADTSQELTKKQKKQRQTMSRVLLAYHVWYEISQHHLQEAMLLEKLHQTKAGIIRDIKNHLVEAFVTIHNTKLHLELDTTEDFTIKSTNPLKISSEEQKARLKKFDTKLEELLALRKVNEKQLRATHQILDTAEEAYKLMKGILELFSNLRNNIPEEQQSLMYVQQLNRVARDPFIEKQLSYTLNRLNDFVSNAFAKVERELNSLAQQPLNSTQKTPLMDALNLSLMVEDDKKGVSSTVKRSGWGKMLEVLNEQKVLAKQGFPNQSGVLTPLKATAVSVEANKENNKNFTNRVGKYGLGGITAKNTNAKSSLSVRHDKKGKTLVPSM